METLFVEELTKAVLEAGILIEDAGGLQLVGPLPPLAIPETLRDSLMARLDRLAPVREIGQVGAVIGREFSYSLLHVLVGRDETALKNALAQLEQTGLVFRRGEPPEALYSFKHVLVRDAAYESLLGECRGTKPSCSWFGTPFQYRRPNLAQQIGVAASNIARQLSPSD